MMLNYLLYAEDDREDQELLEELLSKLNPSLGLKVFESGLPLLQYLEGLASEDPEPCCIVLDMNMPGLNGLQTLQRIRSVTQWNHLPVLMFSTSNTSRDEEESKRNGADAFITKPVTQHEFAGVMDRFRPYCYPAAAK